MSQRSISLEIPQSCRCYQKNKNNLFLKFVLEN